VLKTDASNSGLGAVLLQENENKQLVPVSKKLTLTEERYAIIPRIEDRKRILIEEKLMHRGIEVVYYDNIITGQDCCKEM
jgi:RNase H-like domain found in reverse transcriptase